MKKVSASIYRLLQLAFAKGNLDKIQVCTGFEPLT